MRTFPNATTRARDESGIAMVSVISLTAILTIIAAVAINYVVVGERFSRGHQDWNAALAAAEAGVDDYLARLNRDRGYFFNSAGDIDPDTLQNLNPALDRWAQLPGSDGAWYRYEVDDSEVLVNGTLVLTSTGRVRDATRTVEVRLRPRSPFDFLYWTNFETIDPALLSPPRSTAECGQPFATRPSACGIIRFITGDVLDGPVHSNDVMRIQGSPRFEGEVTSSASPWPVLGYVPFQPAGEPTPTPFFRFPGDPSEVPVLAPPTTNTAIRDSAALHGCVYYGPTYIHLRADGTMTVRSPLSANNGAGPPTRPECLDTSPTQVGNFQSGIPIPPVIYVETAAACPSPFSDTNHPLGINRNHEGISGLRPLCINGDAFIWGDHDSQLTVASRHDINIIWDLTYTGAWENGTAILGLAAQNFVQIRQPSTATSAGPAAQSTRVPVAHRAPFPRGHSGEPPAEPSTAASGEFFVNPTVHAAMFSLSRSIRVQNHDRVVVTTPSGSDNNVFVVRGAMAQNFRGPVGVSYSPFTGYLKDYSFDDRLRFIAPPYFPDFVESEYVIRAWAEVRDPAPLPQFPNP